MEKKPKKGAPNWMVSFCDLMQLLLTFFIMLFATSSTDAAKLEELVSSFSRGNSLFEQNKSDKLVELDKKPLGESNESSIDNEKEYDETAKKIDEKKEALDKITMEYNSKESQIIDYELKEKLQNLGYSDEEINSFIEVSATSEGILVTFKDGVLFAPGSTKVKDTNEKLLIALGETFDKDTSIKIEGHTDNVPTTGSEYESNWELSTARAISVMKYLTTKGFINETNCSVSGFGEFKPIADNTTDEKRALNRRVEILLINS